MRNLSLAFLLASAIVACGGGGDSPDGAPSGTPATPAPPSTPDTTSPTAPSGLSANAASAGLINLTWTASTDNVGVSGYRLERCQGAGCANFAQVATPAGPSFSDGWDAAPGEHELCVRATDAAGNLSAFSTVTTATTPAPTPPPPLPNLPAWVNALAIGQWLSVPNTALSSVAPSPVPAGNTGPQSKVIAWTSFVVDTRTSKL